MDYKGYLVLSDEEAIANFYSNHVISEPVYENEYVFIEKDIYKFINGEFERVDYKTIDNIWSGIIRPRNIEQQAAIDLLSDRTSKVKIIRGVYGSGKDMLMFNKALSLIENEDFDKIIFIRPNLTLKNVPAIGALPGEIDDKLGWTYAPLYDKVGGKDGLDRLIMQNKLEMVPLLFLRGYSFQNSIVYVTEGQNIDTEIAKLLLGRIGEGSELWINGDNHQTDSRIFDKDNGLTKMLDRLKGNKLFGYVYLPKTERSDVANLANLLDEE